MGNYKFDKEIIKGLNKKRANKEIRTLDLTITNRLLYQLSYVGAGQAPCLIRDVLDSPHPLRYASRAGRESVHLDF